MHIIKKIFCFLTLNLSLIFTITGCKNNSQTLTAEQRTYIETIANNIAVQTKFAETVEIPSAEQCLCDKIESNDNEVKDVFVVSPEQNQFICFCNLYIGENKENQYPIRVTFNYDFNTNELNQVEVYVYSGLYAGSYMQT